MEVGNSSNHNHNNNNNNNISGSTSACMMMENGLYPMIMIPHHHHNQSHNSHHNNSNNINHENNNNNNNNIKVCCCSSSSSTGCYEHHHHNQQQQHHHHHQLMAIMENHHHHQNNVVDNGVTIACNNGGDVGGSSSSSSAGNNNIKAKIMAHPHYPRLLSAFVSCQKVGAPPEVVARLEEAEAMVMNQGGGRGGGGGGNGVSGYVGEDPSLDQFMEAYCEMLTKYEQELTKPFKEAMLFLSRVECQFKALTLSSPSDSPTSACGEVPDRNGSSEEDIDVNNNFIDPSAEDRELKGQLLRRYSGCLGNLRQEFLKKRKKGKLPKEARQQLLDWWSRHYKWPYPSESQKLALAESTGLDQKQINNWFINQRKRHWKPSEDMQFVVMDAAAHSHAHHPHYGYMDNVLGNPFPMDVSPTLM